MNASERKALKKRVQIAEELVDEMYGFGPQDRLKDRRVRLVTAVITAVGHMEIENELSTIYVALDEIKGKLPS